MEKLREQAELVEGIALLSVRDSLAMMLHDSWPESCPCIGCKTQRDKISKLRGNLT